MRRARITYQGAYHHAMNRGHEGKRIFQNDSDKIKFLDLLKKISGELRIRIFAYCIMDNHYHLVLENSSGAMSEFFKKFNGQYGRIYRKKINGKGYVFQNRYKSTLIQDESFLITVIGYVLNNPVRGGLVKNFLDYRWSSSKTYFRGDDSGIVDHEYIEELFGNFDKMYDYISNLDIKELPVVKTRFGNIIGEKNFKLLALKKFNRRKPGYPADGNKRIDDFHFDPVKKIFFEFKKIHKIDIQDIDTKTYIGKRLRGYLLVYLKDKAGLKYSEINKYPIFSDVKLYSLGKLYQYAKARMEK